VRCSFPGRDSTEYAFQIQLEDTSFVSLLNVFHLYAKFPSALNWTAVILSQRKMNLLSPAERSFFGVLESLDYDGVTIASKVRLADIFGNKRGLGHGDRHGAPNRITAKHVDFLLIQSSDGRPLLGIELDDASHEEYERGARDLFVESVFSSAGLPILHVAAKTAYDPKEVHRQIDGALQKSG
jgi:hypothetical protein